MIDTIKMKYRGFCCDEYSNIENYNDAITSSEQYCIHHRLETHTSDGIKREVCLTSDELKALGMYYNRPASELIFMPISEHTILHNTFVRCKEHSKATKEKMSKSHKGIAHADTWKKHQSESLKAMYLGGGTCKPRKYFQCIETNEVHYLNEWRRLGFRLNGSGDIKTCKGLHFELVKSK